jgi:hypothetical protein
MKQIEFKTLELYFSKEKSGIKNNTVRLFKIAGDRREKILKDWIKKPFELNIKIVNPKTKEYFVRRIRDVTYYGCRYIITWEELEE